MLRMTEEIHYKPQNTQSQGRDLIPGHPESQVTVLTTLNDFTLLPQCKQDLCSSGTEKNHRRLRRDGRSPCWDSIRDLPNKNRSANHHTEMIITQ